MGVHECENTLREGRTKGKLWAIRFFKFYMSENLRRKLLCSVDYENKSHGALI